MTNARFAALHGLRVGPVSLSTTPVPLRKARALVTKLPRTPVDTLAQRHRWKEWVAGTNPTNRLDFFRIGACRPGPVNPLLELPSNVLEWQSATGRTHNRYYATALEHQTTVWTLLDQVSGTGAIISYTNAWPDPVAFYLLDVSVAAGP